MATIKYKCDTCKREIELIENKAGMTTFNNCTITNKCAGKLYSNGRNPNNLRESIPTPSTVLDDYQPRKLLYVHPQRNSNLKWVVEHNMGLSCVVIVYDANSQIMDADAYIVESFPTYSNITFTLPQSGVAHIISRTANQTAHIDQSAAISTTIVSGNGILTFGIPKYITRIDSGATLPTEITPTPTSLPTQPYSSCNNTIQIEIEVQRPNEGAITCSETLEALIVPSAWAGWGNIMVKNRKLYCLKSKAINSLKVLANTNNGNVNIPDGTTFKILRIDYGTGIFTDIPDRGLLMMLSTAPHTGVDKDLRNIVDCGELVGMVGTTFVFKNSELYINSKYVESTYPKIVKL